MEKMETQIIDVNARAGTLILTDEKAATKNAAWEIADGENEGWEIEGWKIEDKLSTQSGEADIYLARKDGVQGIVKYYRSVSKPKTEILEKIKQLNHPDIVKVYDYGIYKKRFYEIMEYAEGGALDSRGADGTYRYLPMPEDKALQVCEEVLNSFAICHQAGIIHRDIKPANIYFRKPGQDAVIADFGISSIMDETEGLHQTRTGSRTTGYAAPEVFSGIISPKMDYYALGITLWQLLTGKDPFALDNGKRRNDAHLIRDTIEGRIADDLLSREPRLSRKLERLIRGLLVIDPDHRWGRDEVCRHLAGEMVEVYQKAEKTWAFSIGAAECTTLEALGSALLDYPEDGKKKIFRGLLTPFLADFYPDMARQIDQIAEESSAVKEYDQGLLKAAYLLHPGLPLKIENGFAVRNISDVLFMLRNAPESILPPLRDNSSRLHTYLELLGYGGQSAAIKKLPPDMTDVELADQAEGLLGTR